MAHKALVTLAALFLLAGAACAADEDFEPTLTPSVFSLTGEVVRVAVDEEDDRIATLWVTPDTTDDAEGLLDCLAEPDGSYPVDVDLDELGVAGDPEELEGGKVEMDGDVELDVTSGECSLSADSITLADVGAEDDGAEDDG